jgi:hypothetical protein
VTGLYQWRDELQFLPGNTLKTPAVPKKPCFLLFASSLVPLWYLFGTSESGEAKRRNRGSKEEAKRRHPVNLPPEQLQG